jgi:hypothetical protein
VFCKTALVTVCSPVPNFPVSTILFNALVPSSGRQGTARTPLDHYSEDHGFAFGCRRATNSGVSDFILVVFLVVVLVLFIFFIIIVGIMIAVMVVLAVGVVMGAAIAVAMGIAVGVAVGVVAGVIVGMAAGAGGGILVVAIVSTTPRAPVGKENPRTGIHLS